MLTMHSANMKIKHTVNELNDFISCDIQISHALTMGCNLPWDLDAV